MDFSFSRYLDFTSYADVGNIVLKDYASNILAEAQGTSLNYETYNTGRVYNLIPNRRELMESTIKKYFMETILIDNSDYYLGCFTTPLKKDSPSDGASSNYIFYGKYNYRTGIATISLSPPGTELSITQKPISVSGESVPGYVIKADAQGNPIWAEDDVGVKPIGPAVKNYVIKINSEGIPEWLPEDGGTPSEDGIIKIDPVADQYSGYVLILTGREGNKYVCKWVDVNRLVFELPENGEPIL